MFDDKNPGCMLNEFDVVLRSNKNTLYAYMNVSIDRSCDVKQSKLKRKKMKLLHDETSKHSIRNDATRRNTHIHTRHKAIKHLSSKL